MKKFLNDTLQGLSESPKKLSSRYLYDTVGDGIFQEIMAMPEYYLPACELEIIQTKTAEIAELLPADVPIEVVELGAGDGTKTVQFLNQLGKVRSLAAYYPLDISANILDENVQNIHKRLPQLTVKPVPGNYFETFPPERSGRVTRLNLFLGSNIGNFNQQQTQEFFAWMHKNMQPGDALLVAFDLKKDPTTILAAYNDKAGITARFNLNLLTRIKRELGANFVLENFVHYPVYNPETGLATSYLMSTKAQSVLFPDGKVFHFEPFETINTEISKKFSLTEIEGFAKQNRFSISHYLDSKTYYTLSLLSTIND